MKGVYSFVTYKYTFHLYLNSTSGYPDQQQTPPSEVGQARACSNHPHMDGLREDRACLLLLDLSW